MACDYPEFVIRDRECKVCGCIFRSAEDLKKCSECERETESIDV